MIDAHQHFWQLGRFDYSWLDAAELSVIRRDYLPEHLKPKIDKAGITQTIFVQTQHNTDENRWVLDLAKQHDWIAGVVGWVDLASPDCESQLAEFKDHPKFVGIRHVTQDEPDDNFIVNERVLNGLRILERHSVPFDLLFYVKHLHHAKTLGKKLPNLPMVIDHLSKPEIKKQNFDPWKKDLLAAAEFPNVFCKLSGMVTEADWNNWKPADLKPYVETAIDAFGPQRCMFGSDWPVCELAASYQQVVSTLSEIVGSISDTEKQQIFGETAKSFYRLK